MAQAIGHGRCPRSVTEAFWSGNDTSALVLPTAAFSEFTQLAAAGSLDLVSWSHQLSPDQLELSVDLEQLTQQRIVAATLYVSLEGRGAPLTGIRVAGPGRPAVARNGDFAGVPTRLVLPGPLRGSLQIEAIPIKDDPVWGSASLKQVWLDLLVSE